jgi:hypothetical protein
MFDGLDAGAGGVLGVLAAMVSVASLGINVILTRRAQRFAAEALRLDIDRQLIAWADEVLDAMGRASQVASGPGDWGSRSDVLRDLSVLLDRGRWHAPNIPDPDHGVDKPAAYQGYRQPVLDCIFEVHRVIDEGGTDAPGEMAAIMDARRRFVSAVQTLTDPRRRREFLRRAETSKTLSLD